MHWFLTILVHYSQQEHLGQVILFITMLPWVPINLRIICSTMLLGLLYGLSYNSLLKVSIPFIVCFAACGTLPALSQVSPLCATRFSLELQQHPDQALVSEVLQGLFQGFRLGFNPGFSLHSAKKNKASTYQHPEIVHAYLANEVTLGRVAGPFPAPPLPNLHINSFGIITNGALFWTCPPHWDRVSTKESTQTIILCNTSELMTSSRWFQSSVKVL